MSDEFKGPLKMYQEIDVVTKDEYLRGYKEGYRAGFRDGVKDSPIDSRGGWNDSGWWRHTPQYWR